MGDKLEWFISLQDSGVKVPVLEERPDLDDEDFHYWKAYNTLSSSRRLGMGAGSIPLTEILAYCELYLITNPDDRLWLTDIVLSLDSFYLDISSKKESKNGSS